MSQSGEESKAIAITKPTSITRSAGRPTTFNPSLHVARVKALVDSGVRTHAQIAASLGIDRTTLWRWAKESPELELELNIGKTQGEAHLIDVLYQIGIGALKGNPTALAMIGNNVYGWKGEGNGGNNTYIQNNISLTYDQINGELQKYFDMMGVKNLKEVQESIVNAEFHDSPQ